ncbi:MAG: cytochrome c biogenesis protein CcdA, partial [Thermoanaerobaculia bacterium]
AQVDDLYLDLTLVTPSFLESRRLGHYLGDRNPETVLPFLAGLNTHRGSIDHMHHLHGEMFLIAPDGTRYPSLSEPIVLSQHHNAYMLLFPARDQRGERFLDYAAGNLVVEAVGVGAEPVRRFEWQLPLADAAAAPGLGRGLVPSLMLLVALVGALLVVLSPCALELSLYYSAIISCTVTEGEREAAAAGAGSAATAGRRRILINLGAFVAGFTLLYAVSGATVGLIGEGVRRPLAEYAEIIPMVGGALILFFALKVMGVGELIGRLRRRWPGGERGVVHGSRGSLGTLLAAPGRFLTGLRTRAQARSRLPGGMRPRDSFLVGVGLSSSCVTCMGGAVLYPLLVYVGISSWYWGFLTLGLYSLGIALPMLAIALGFFRVRLSLTRRLGFNRGLRFASGALLAGIGTLILTGQERIVTDVAFGLLGGISRWFA